MISGEQTIRLGLLAPLSGIVELYGEDISWAARVAVDEINEKGGLLGRRLELLIRDDGSQPERALPAARQLVEEDHCVALIGNLLSNSRIAIAAQVAEPQKIPYLNFSFYEGSISSRYFFNFAALPNQQIARMIPYMADRYGLKMFFAGNNYEWPRGSIDAAQRVLEAIGGSSVGEIYLPIGNDQASIDALLDEVARSGADVFVPYFAGADQVLLLNRFYELGLKDRMAVVMGHYDEAMVSRLRPQVREGLYSSNTYFMSVDSAAGRDYFLRLQQLPEVNGIWPAGNGVLTNFGEGTYVCVKAFAEAVRIAGSTAAEDLVEALEQVQVNAPQGRVCMDADTHHAEVNSYLACCNSDGTFRLVKSFGSIRPEIPARYQDNDRSEDRSQAVTYTDSVNRALPSVQQVNGANEILSIADMAVLAADEEARITDANRGALELFGYNADEMIGLSLHLLVPPPLRSRHRQHFKSFVDGELTQLRMHQRSEVSGYRKDGTFFPMEATISKFRKQERWVMVATIRDLTVVKQAETELTWRATHDPLTRLPNRVLIADRIRQALQRSKRVNNNIAVLFIDLDGFKEINDSYGHKAGDVLLQEVSKRLIETVRPGDTVGRLAGDEFVVVCETVAHPSDMASVAERIQLRVAEEVEYAGQSLLVSASIGIAIGHGSTHSVDDLMRNADTAMYAVKQSGRDGWKFFSDSLQDESSRRLELSIGLRHALEKDEFYMVMQPIVAADSGRIEGAEMLLRWRAAHGEVSPAVFIPVAEMTQVIVRIGYWVFRQACLAESRLRKRFDKDAPYLSVNISARQLQDEQLFENFRNILKETQAKAENIRLEITETSLMADMHASQQMVEKLSSLGMHLAVDDFGTGYSSLAQLLRLKAHTLKIDREFICQLEESRESQAIVAAISRLARIQKMQLVAEGVETEVQNSIVQVNGIHSIQGFYHYRPMLEASFHEEVAKSLANQVEASEPLYFLIYVSRPGTSLQPADYQSILDTARKHNRRQAITGYLLLMDGTFLQYLEGPRNKLFGLYDKISADPRHHDVQKIVEGPLDSRLFVDWNMGYRRLQESRLLGEKATGGEYPRAYEWYCENPQASCTIFEAIAAYL